MKQVRVVDLIDLIHASAPEPDKRLEKVFDWQIQRRLETAKWTLGAAVSLVVGIGVASTNSTAAITPYHWISVGVASAILLLWGLHQFRQSRELAQCFLGSITLLNRLARIRAFIALYRSLN